MSPDIRQPRGWVWRWWCYLVDHDDEETVVFPTVGRQLSVTHKCWRCGRWWSMTGEYEPPYRITRFSQGVHRG